MKKPFEDTRFGSLCSAVIEVLWAGILFLIFSLPVVTIGASASALYYVTVKCIRHERGNLTSEFWKSFKDSFKVATILWVIYLIVIIPVLMNRTLFPYYALPVLCTVPWVFSYVSRFSDSALTTLKNCLILAVKNIGKTIVLALLLVIGGAVAWFLPAVAILLPGIVCLGMSYLIEPVYKIITSNMESDENEDQWYNE